VTPEEERASREPVIQAPLSLTLLIAAIVAAHLVRIFAPAPLSNQILATLAFVPSRYLALSADLHGWTADAVPFVGYLFLHANFTHLIVNCLWLLAFGTPVARRLGPWLFLALFFLSGVAAACAHLASNWGSSDGAVGASGAIAGVMGAGLRMVWLSAPWGRRDDGPLLPLRSRQVAVFSLVWLVANVLTGVTGFLSFPGMGPIAWQAHIGGYVFGLLFAGTFDRLRGRKPESLAA
jgi:membrane associated rhomboid family serine protease